MKKYEAPAFSKTEYETKDVIAVSGLICLAAPPENDTMTVTYESLWTDE